MFVSTQNLTAPAAAPPAAPPQTGGRPTGNLPRRRTFPARGDSGSPFLPGRPGLAAAYLDLRRKNWLEPFIGTETQYIPFSRVGVCETFVQTAGFKVGVDWTS